MIATDEQKTQLSVRITGINWDMSFERNGVFYSTQIPLSDANGLLCLYSPVEEILDFHGPKLWVTIEPSWHSFWNKGIGKKVTKFLKSDEIAYYGHPNPDYRIPHLTSYSKINPFEKLRVTDSPTEKAVAVVSNYGGRIHFLKRHIQIRNKLILCPSVDLYGRRESWNQYRHFPLLWKVSPPSNYCGEISRGYDALISLISQYKVNVCLENNFEPYYFTEKFVNSVRAGCIPIYHAHPTVKETFLKGAIWIDPSDFNFDPLKTIEFALEQNIHHYRSINDEWLDSDILKSTTVKSFYAKACQIIERKLFSYQKPL
jgi:hypothetical protein